jgi:hypothetical protein
MKTKFISLLIVLVLLPLTSSAQQCKLTDTVVGCWMRFNPAAGTDVTEKTPAEADTQKDVAAANTGISSLVSPSGSAVKDFLSLLSMSLESSTLTSKGQAFTFDYNPPFKILGADHPLKLQAAFAEAKLNSQLNDHFANAAPTLKKFTDSLTDTDDVAFSASFQPTSERFGRSLVPHRKLFQAMLNGIAPDRSDWQQALLKVVADSEDLESEEQTFSSLPEEKRENVMEDIEAAAKEQQTFLRAVGGFAGAFAQLLNNQPQLYASALYNARKNVVGPNDLTGKLTYEIGWHNLNSFLRSHGSRCNKDALAIQANEDTEAAATRAEKCVGLLQTFAEQDVTDDDRVVVSIEYHRTNQRWIKGDPNLGGFEFGYPSAHNLASELKYGRTMQGKATDKNNGRIDLSFRYEDVRNPSDASKNVKSRAIGAITYTLKVSDSVSIPVSLLYANHKSDLGDVDKKLNAHFGLVYKLPTK